MKSPSKQQQTENTGSDSYESTCSQINQALDQSVNNMDSETLSDIAQARNYALRNYASKNKALKIAQRKKASEPGFLKELVLSPFSAALVPLAMAVIAVVSVNVYMVSPIPELPLAMVTGEIPTEDLTLLKDLEFVIWLAENEKSALL